MSARPWRMVASSQPNKSAMYLQPPCPSFSASTAAYLRRSFSDKDWYSIRIWCSMCAEYMVYLPDRKQTGSAPDTFQRKTATRNREVILRLPLIVLLSSEALTAADLLYLTKSLSGNFVIL